MNLIRELVRVVKPAVGARRALLGPMRPSWSHDFEVVAFVLRSSSSLSTHLPLAWQRRIIDPKRPPTRVVRETEQRRELLDEVPVEWFRRPESDPERLLIYLHGGGYSVGSIDSHRDLIARLCRATGCTVLAVDYRLAPEHPFPAQLEDVRTVWRRLLRDGYDPRKMVLAGESAGGGLTLSTMLALRDAGEPLPVAAVVISPWVDLEGRGASFRTNRRYDYVTGYGLRRYARRFVDRKDLRNPLAAPIHANLRGLPPLLVQAGGAETLLDDARALTANAAEAGVEAELQVWEDMIHAFHVFAPILEDARDAIDAIATFVKGRMH